jgi:hypothetical protein
MVQLDPVQPGLHAQLPLYCATPFPLHVVQLPYWHTGPVKPKLHEHAPFPEMPWLQLPWPLQTRLLKVGHGWQNGP